MSLTQDRRSSVGTRSVSLILPQMPGSILTENIVAEYRRILEEEAGFHSVEVIVSSTHDGAGSNGAIKDPSFDDGVRRLRFDVTSGRKTAIGPGWSGRVWGRRPVTTLSSLM